MAISTNLGSYYQQYGDINDPTFKRPGQFNLNQARDEAYGLARGAASAKNPQDAAILAMLQQRAGADGGPYDAATRAALMTQASDTAGQIALNSKNRIQGSAGDPSVMAANNEADARRLQAIQQAQLGINSQANVANYDARGQAIGQLAGVNQMVQNRQIDNQRYLIDMLRNEQRYTPDASGIPSFIDHRAATAPYAGPELLSNPAAGKPPGRSDGQQNPVNYGDPYADARAANLAANTAYAANPTYASQDTTERQSDYRLQDLRNGTGAYAPVKTISPTALKR